MSRSGQLEGKSPPPAKKQMCFEDFARGSQPETTTQEASQAGSLADEAEYIPNFGRSGIDGNSVGESKAQEAQGQSQGPMESAPVYDLRSSGDEELA